MYILGINFSSHDTSACLVKDGKIIGFIEEERLTRHKHTSEYPAHAINLLLKQEKITFSDLDYIAIPTTHSMPIKTLLRFSLSFGLIGLMLVVMNFKYRFKYWRTLQRLKYRVRKTKTKIHFVEHHTAHSSTAFLVSPFDKAAILTIDCEGDGFSGRFSMGEGTSMKSLRSVEMPTSIGHVYYLVTQYLGFGSEGGEGKVMGLASYGDANRYIDIFRDLVQLGPNGTYKLNGKFFVFKRSNLLSGSVDLSNEFIKLFGPPRKSGDPMTKQYEDIAAALQRITEETIAHMLNFLHEQTKCDNLVVGGGVALNSVMNGKIHRLTPFKNVFVQPLAYDGGNSIGAAFYVWNVLLGNPRQYVFDTCYLGPEYSSDEIKTLLDEALLSYEKLDDPSQKAAELLADGKIIGWFQGRMEAGARALGNRSILADPRKAEMKDIVNKRVKHREPFRPFAPAILQEKVGEYFEDNLPVLFMEKVFAIKKDKQSVIPAVAHVDGTGRLQTVTKLSNLKYYNIIKAFDNITGVPVILNTSFNIRGEPIVCTPLDAIKCFYTTGLDYLIMDNFLIKK